MALAVFALGGCAVSSTETGEASPTPAAEDLKPGEAIAVTVAGEPELSGTYELDGEGRFTMPRLGAIDAEALTPAQVEARVAALLEGGPLLEPEVRVVRAAPLPIFVHGGVERPGSYVYRADLTVAAAIAGAGGALGDLAGYDVFVAPGGQPSAARVVRPEAALAPGDVIEVRKRDI